MRYSKMWEEGEVPTSPGLGGQHHKPKGYDALSPKCVPRRTCSSLSKKCGIKVQRLVIRVLLLRRSSSPGSGYWRISDTLECGGDENHLDVAGSRQQHLQRREQQLKPSGTKRWKIIRTLKRLITIRSKKSSDMTSGLLCSFFLPYQQHVVLSILIIKIDEILSRLLRSRDEAV